MSTLLQWLTCWWWNQFLCKPRCNICKQRKEKIKQLATCQKNTNRLPRGGLFTSWTSLWWAASRFSTTPPRISTTSGTRKRRPRRICTFRRAIYEVQEHSPLNLLNITQGSGVKRRQAKLYFPYQSKWSYTSAHMFPHCLEQFRTDFMNHLA